MSCACNDVKPLEISNLPPEVFPHIFKHLSVNERKPVKLVCKAWLEYCNIPSLLNDEVLTCLDIYQLSDIYGLLNKSERPFLNLKFEKVTFNDGSSFWKNNGLRIRSIDFNYCQFHNNIFEEIVIGCENLFHLSFAYPHNHLYRDKKAGELIPPIIDFEKVAAKGIVRENLTSLKVRIFTSDQFQLSDHVIHQLFLVFPSIKVLDVYSFFRTTEDVRLDLSEVPSKNHVTLAPVLNYLVASRNRIEKLKLSIACVTFSPSSLRCIFETVCSLNRLTELFIDVRTKNPTKIEDLGPLVFSNQLKSLEFHVVMDSNDLMPCLSQLLHSNPSLEYLKVHQSYTSITVTKAFYEKLISSGLKNCVLEGSVLELEDPESFSSCLATRNKGMSPPSLSVSVSCDLDWEKNQAVLQYFQSIHNLQLDEIYEEELEFLLKYQKKLKSLRIFSEYWNEFMEISPDDLTFNELTDIEYLELDFTPAACYFLRTLTPEPILAKLKYLKIDIQGIDAELLPLDLLRSADAMPFLEALYIGDGYVVEGYTRRHHTTSFDVIVELCTKLTRLRYFYFVGYWRVENGHLTDEHYRRLFSVCPSLQVLIHFGKERVTYFFDTTKGEVVLKQNKRQFRLGRPRIGERDVYWLTY